MHYGRTDVKRGEPLGLAVTFEADDPRSEDAIEIEAAMPWLIRVAIGARSLLFGRAIDSRSVWLLRADTAESPGILPPIRASRAREAARHDWWLELVAELLAEGARFPEPRGRWQLTPMATADGTARSYRSLDPDELPAPAYALDHTLERPSLFEEPWHVRGS